jgi:O-antigen/teichoic acid export membrane protein
MKVAAQDINYQFWANAYNTGISFALFVVLAHFLAPLEFGLYALGTVVAAILYTLGQAGFVSLAYSEINRSETVRNTLFWANIITACSVVCLANAVIYVTIADPEKRLFMITLVSTLLITSVGEVANVALLTAQRFRELALKQFTVQTIGAAAALIAAFGGRGAWALVIQRCVAGFFEIIFVFWLLRWRPRLVFDFAKFKSLLPSAIGFAGNSSLSTLETRLGDLVLAFVSTLDQVAAYRIAARVMDSISSLTIQPIFSVACASVAAAEPSNKGAVYIAHVRLLLWVGAIPFAGLLCFGDIIIPLVFGATWAESGIIAQILATGFFVSGPVCITESALTATGRPKDLVRLHILSILISAPLILTFGMIGTKFIAAAISLRAMLLMPVYIKATHFLTGLSTYQTLKITLLPYFVALSSAFVARVVFQLTLALSDSPFAALAFGVLVGGGAFGGLFFRLGKPELKSIVAWKRS